MKVSEFFVQTLREVPSDAVLASHQLLMRGGYIKPMSTGVFSIFPLGKRVLSKIQNIIREEMNNIQGQEVELPLVHTAELWQEAGRYDVIGSELLRFKDRNNHDMVLAMTHEEAITDMARSVLSSWRQLPFMLYQFQLKYRDEARARGGLVRVREFVMKDGYSFHTDADSLDEYYQKAHDAYVRIFNRVGINPVIVKSDTGIMGGKEAHEFMLETPHGEDYLIICRKCGYQANAEIAEFKREEIKEEALPLEEVATPEKESIEELSEFLNIEASKTAKMVFYEVEEKLYTLVVRGDLEVSEIKVKNHLKTNELIPASSELIKACGMEPGYASPIDAKNTVVLVDESVAKNSNFVVGANKVGFHLKNANLGRDFEADTIGDFAQADTGCSCPNCSDKLEATRGIEIGNIFKLGTKFSEAMGANYLDEAGKRHPAVMGCYGIGVGRLMASVVEQHHDDWGIIWPKEIAPFQVHLVSLGNDDSVKEAAEKLHQDLSDAGIDVLWDDRKERPGVKFKDADLWGIPVRISVGAKALKENAVEWKLRSQGKGFDLVNIDEVCTKVLDFYK